MSPISPNDINGRLGAIEAKLDGVADWLESIDKKVDNHQSIMDRNSGMKKGVALVLAVVWSALTIAASAVVRAQWPRP